MAPVEVTKRVAAQTLVTGSVSVMIYNLIDAISDLHNWHGIYDTPSEAMAVARQIVPLAFLAAAQWVKRRQVWSDEQRRQNRSRA